MDVQSSHESPDVAWRWTRLLDYIQAGLVVPIVGRELLWSTGDGHEQSVPLLLARRLAERAGLPWTAALDHAHDPVGATVQRLLESPKGRNWPYMALYQLTADLAASSAPPPALLKLAEIPFGLFVSTTSDNFLERAVDAVRFSGESRTVVPAYGLGSSADLSERGTGGCTVFPLLGRANPSGDYAITEEDVLEFVYQFQVTDTPRRLLETLRQSHLLIIGSGFSDWLTRFFVRMASPGRLWGSSGGQLTHFVADEAASGDDKLRAFLQHPLGGAEVFLVQRADQFVDELHRRWKARFPDGIMPGPTLSRGAVTAVSLSAGAPVPFVGGGGGGVFLSYANEDYDAACRVRDALDRAGIDVWFDRRGLQAGHDYEQRIRQQISQSRCFVAVISHHSLTSEPRFFRLEWREAEERSRFVAFDQPYIMPVCLDGTEASDSRLPDFIRRLHWTLAPSGHVPDAFIDTIVATYRQGQRRRA